MSSVVDIFRSKCRSVLQYEVNGYDMFLYPTIDESKRSSARSNFGTGMEETILLIRDTGFWNNCDQGLVLTSDGIYCIPDNEKPDERIVFGWHSVKEVRYQELCLYFYGYDGDSVPIHITYFAKTDDESKLSRIGRSLASAFTCMGQAVAPLADPFEEAANHIIELEEADKLDEAIDYIKECQGADWIADWQFVSLGHELATLYMKRKQFDAALEACDESLPKVEKGADLHIQLAYLKYSVNDILGKYKEARKDCLDVVRYAADQKRGDDVLIKEDAKNDFEKYEKQYQESFLKLPYNERKVLMPVKQYTDLDQEHLSVIKIDSLPNVCFPMGHPVANQLYVGHPLIASKYIPFDSYQLELVEDKVREFCQLAQSLGATEISIECLNATSSDTNRNGQRNGSLNAGYWVADISADYSNNYSHHMIDELSRSISLHQTFEPHSKPSKPDGLVWYDNEPSWQRLVSQRINGGLTSHEERIETKKSQMVEGQEMTAIKGEIDALFAGMNISLNKTDEEKLKQQENAVISIKVTFAPMSQLSEASLALIQVPEKKEQLKSAGLTQEEEEYLEELKECLADGKIGPRERRLLDKIRTILCITESRAQELEQSLSAIQLTDEEQEYLNEFKECAVDGTVSEKERRLLEKVRKMLGITEERAKELETIK